MEKQWQSSDEEGGTVAELAEHGKDWRNSGRALKRKVEQWQSIEKIRGTVAEQ